MSNLLSSCVSTAKCADQEQIVIAQPAISKISKISKKQCAVDLDYFKDINDTLGDGKDDVWLKKVAIGLK